MKISSASEQYLHIRPPPPSTASQIILKMSLYYTVTVGMILAEGRPIEA